MSSAAVLRQVLHFGMPRFGGRAQLATALLALSTYGSIQAMGVAASTNTTLAVSSDGTSLGRAAAGQVAAGNIVTLTATVIAGGFPVTTGQVRFCDASAALCSDIHLLGTAQLTSRGTALVRLRPAVGTHSYRAVFLGTRVHAASSSAEAMLIVAGTYPTAASIMQSITDGQAILSAAVQGIGGAVAPGGVVRFLDASDGNRELGSAELGPGVKKINFQPTPNLQLDDTPAFVAAGDFNGDGRTDLFVASEGTGRGTVLLANGNGTFTRVEQQPLTGLRTGEVAVGDFNGDGNLDLAVSNPDDNSVSILLGKGDGTFISRTPVPAGAGPMAIAIGDFNHDGIADLAVAGETSGALTLLLGNGDGTFTAASESPSTGTPPDLIVAGDFNGDGNEDLAVSNGETVTVLLGKGDGAFTRGKTVAVGAQSAGKAMGMVAADVYGDGRLDLAILFEDREATVLGNGDGTFLASPEPLRTGEPYFEDGYLSWTGSSGPQFSAYRVPDSANLRALLSAQPAQAATATLSLDSSVLAEPHRILAHYEGDNSYSASVSATVDVLPVVATPKFSPKGGQYTKPQMVKISDATPGATIYYALHGITPTSRSTKYIAPIEVKTTEAIAAIALKKGSVESAVARAKYTIDELPAAKPEFSPAGGPYSLDQHVEITDSTLGAAIYYTTDGTVPTSKSTRYTRRILVSGRETITAIAEAPDYKPSPIALAHYDITLQAATPVFHPAGGSFSKPQQVTITDSTSGVSIYYTTDGSTPTTQSALYTGPIKLPVSTEEQILKAVAGGAGFMTSAVANAVFTIIPVVATPVFYPAPGTYSSMQSVTISDSTANTSIYYTTDGTTPSTGSKEYAGAINVAGNETIQAIAVVGGNQSAVGSAMYKITAGMAAPPLISTAKARNGASIVSLSSTTAGSTIYYTLDNSTPTSSSTVYLAPFLVASQLTVSAIAVRAGYSNSPVTIQYFSTQVPSGTLVWSDEFTNKTGSIEQPDPKVWSYDTGNSGFGNHELENYCAWGSNTAPCSTSNPNAYVGTDGYLHIVARQPSAGVYTSARLKTQGLFSFRYGRMEVRAMVPEAQGFWPAAWLLGNNIATVNWPACGEQDDLERVNAALNPDWNEGSIHGTGFTGGNLGTRYNFPAGQTAAEWHTYGMIWSDGKVEYYIDDPATPYASFTPASLNGLPGAAWPFDGGQSNFILLNLAIGGDYPGPPNSTTPFPSEYVIDYVRIYAN